jgi:hypothetical protein
MKQSPSSLTMTTTSISSSSGLSILQRTGNRRFSLFEVVDCPLIGHPCIWNEVDDY